MSCCLSLSWINKNRVIYSFLNFLNTLFASPTILRGQFLCPWTWGIFFGGIQHSSVDACSVASSNFGVLAEEDEHMSFYSTILITAKTRQGADCGSDHELLIANFRFKLTKVGNDLNQIPYDYTV